MAAYLKAAATNETAVPSRFNQEISVQTTVPDTANLTGTAVRQSASVPESINTSSDPFCNMVEAMGKPLHEGSTHKNRDADPNSQLIDPLKTPSQSSGWQSLILAAVNMACELLSSVLFPWARTLETFLHAILPIFRLR